MALTWVVPAEAPRARLDKLVVHWLERTGMQATRAEVQRAIAEGRVRVDGQPARASASVREGAQLDYEPAPTRPSEARPDASVKFDVAYEDDDLLVVDKPAGLVVHPARGHDSGTLVHGLLARGSFSRIEAGSESSEHARPGIVHRLDKGTSGLLVVAKNERAREALKARFQAHDIEREYVAIVEGTTAEATYATLHGRDPRDRLKFTSRVRTGKRAVTHVRPVESLGPATLVACTLETGRTHQIRVHLAECARAPIVGDPLYGRVPRDHELAALAKALGRQALHARVLGFDHPTTGKAMRWESPVPPDLRALVEALRARLTKPVT